MEPTIGMLATAVGLAAVITLLMNLVVRPMLDPTKFSQFAPSIAIVLGIVLSLVYVVATVASFTGADLLEGVLVGIFGGALSQNVNTAATRLVKPPTS